MPCLANSDRRRRWRSEVQGCLRKYPARLLLLWLFYLAAIEVTIAIPFANAHVVPVWVPTGVGLFVLIWWSPSLWPGIVLALLSVEARPTCGYVLESFVNAVEPAFAAYLYLKIFKRRERIGELAGAAGILLIGGLGSPLLFGIFMQAMKNHSPIAIATTEATDWQSWLAGDFTGVLIMVPLLAALATERFKPGKWRAGRIIELSFAMAAIVVSAALVFDIGEKISPRFDLGSETLGDAFVLFPILTWIAVRFCPTVASSALLLVAAVSTWQTCHDAGPFSRHSYAENVLWLHGFLAVTGCFTTLIAFGKRESDRRQEEVRIAQEQYRLFFRRNPHPMWVCDPVGYRFVEVNDSAVEKYGYSREEFLRMTVRDIRPAEDIPRLEAHLAKNRCLPRDVSFWRHRKKDGSMMDVEITDCALLLEGKPRRLILANDVTEKNCLEAELRQAHKLEAIGRLAGGVAHDFNNVMMIISSYAERLQYGPHDSERVRHDSALILQATERASTLTKELLAFSRKQILMPCVIELNGVVRNMLMLLHRLVGEGVELVFDPAEYVCPVKLDVGQLTQVLLNLCANARDAMDGHGRLTIATAVVRTQCAQMEGDSEMPPGTYGALIVSDGGGGMTPEVRERIFEPFFTTKGIGKGTGLGLATVYGIVRQSGGFISVRSTVGVGSEFRLYFPQAEQPSSPAVEPAKRELLEEGHETILVVEDEAELRSAVVESLRSLGYKVRHASDGRRALEIAEQMPSVDVLVTDVVMPNMRGTEMAKYLRRMFPAMRIIFMSGYADGMVKPEELNAETVFLAKPLTLAKLARTIRDLVSEVVPSGAH